MKIKYEHQSYKFMATICTILTAIMLSSAMWLIFGATDYELGTAFGILFILLSIISSAVVITYSQSAFVWDY